MMKQTAFEAQVHLNVCLFSRCCLRLLFNASCILHLEHFSNLKKWIENNNCVFLQALLVEQGLTVC